MICIDNKYYKTKKIPEYGICLVPVSLKRGSVITLDTRDLWVIGGGFGKYQIICLTNNAFIYSKVYDSIDELLKDQEGFTYVGEFKDIFKRV